MATAIGVATAQMGGPLPAALSAGRSSIAGPQTGGYLSFGLSGYSRGIEIITDSIAYAIEMPMDFRVEAITWSCRTVAAAGGTFQVAQSATLAWAGSETDILSADVALTTAGNEVLVAQGSTQTLVEAARNVDKGAFLMIGLTGDADSTIVDLTVQVHGYPRGQVNPDPADD